LSNNETQILALLKQLPELDFDAIVSSLHLEAVQASEHLLRLTNLHLVESTAGIFSVSPALRVAIERDRRIKLSSPVERDVMKTLASSLTIRLEEGTASIALINAAIFGFSRKRRHPKRNTICISTPVARGLAGKASLRSAALDREHSICRRSA
jgi:hypothetical protein